MNIGYQGIPGAYSDEATQRYIRSLQTESTCTTQGFSTFPQLITALLEGKVDRAVLPVENSTTGMIARTMDLFRYQPIQVVQELYVPIQHRLVGLQGSSIGQVQRVLSHPEALMQCEAFFQAHPWLTAVPYSDTAEAARFVFEEQDETIAALASRRASELYQLETLKKQVQTELDNTTRFYVVQRSQEENFDTQADKVSLYIETSHEPGALTALLQQFEKFQSNLLSLNARPIPQRPFSYGFFMEARYLQTTAAIEMLVSALRPFASHVQVLGYFVAVKEPLAESERYSYDSENDNAY